jgi:hypothetical protein
MSTRGWNVRAAVLCVAVGFLARASAADEAEELAKKSQNPVANMISVPFEENLFFDLGPTDKLANVLNVKPVIPVSLGKMNLINRFILPRARTVWRRGVGAGTWASGRSSRVRARSSVWAT